MFTNIPGLTQAAQLHIVTGTSLPTHTNPRTVPKAWKGKVDQQIQSMLDGGIIERCYSPWTSVIVPVPVAKKGGTVRVCIDYLQVNKVTQTDPYPMPRIEELLESLGKSNFISTLDMSKGYCQVPVAPNDSDKTKGKYRFLQMPFGLKGALSCFQRLMDDILSDMPEFFRAYLDDIIIFSDTWEECLQHFLQVITRLKHHGLTLKMPDWHELLFISWVHGWQRTNRSTDGKSRRNTNLSTTSHQKTCESFPEPIRLLSQIHTGFQRYSSSTHRSH